MHQYGIRHLCVKQTTIHHSLAGVLQIEADRPSKHKTPRSAAFEVKMVGTRRFELRTP